MKQLDFVEYELWAELSESMLCLDKWWKPEATAVWCPRPGICFCATVGYCKGSMHADRTL
jgi:hypothetical protein